MNRTETESVTTGTGPEHQHGAPAGWYRATAAFCVLAAIQMGWAAWSTARGAAAPHGEVPRPALAVFMVLSVIALLIAAFLAGKRRAGAGLFVLAGYAVPAGAIYVAARVAVAPSALMILTMFMLMIASGFRRLTTTHK